MLGLRPFALLLQLGFGAETQIRFAFLQQALGVLLVDRQTVRLTIGSVRPIHVGAFVPVQPEPFEVSDELIFETGFAALDVRIFNAQHHGAAVPTREEPIEQGGTCIAHMEMPCRRRRKTNPDGRI